ncbi:zinc finger BED domain-containing protein RICESLEEPER 2-like [Zea mays]|uniref:zinc finger BED domain-containing protein RICESLEEPER 2-like n=1 Tax=Zea mays TaxID=4577 RepID=UPI0009AAE0CD|nr:zinc finger BED domain-containing protein RICESLEEPER 2-like [Zea mays]|eukprot:XP_020394807.1 zinc finger BED domain-containing protein RICESLEEPER 2-like [Zea mays]
MNLLIFVVGCLDPRYKLSMYTKITVEEIFGEERGQVVWEAINNCVHDLFEEYMKLYSSSEETTDVSDSIASKGGRGRKLKEVIAKRMKLGTGSNSNNKSELDKYLAEETEDTEMKPDLLVWWKASEQRFPILSRLARDVHAIPISSVASESAFSTGGRILDDFCSSLTPFMLEALVCTQDWLRWTIPVDITENIEELTKLEEELFEEFGKVKQAASSKTNVTIRIESNSIDLGTSTI